MVGSQMATGLGLSGLGAALLAGLHSEAPPFHYGGLCGHAAQGPHCLGCYVAVGLILSGLLIATTVAGRATAHVPESIR